MTGVQTCALPICIQLSSQLAGSTPTVGIGLSGVGGSLPAMVSDNNISGAFYGHLIYGVNSSTRSEISGGAITGVMQGVAVINVDPQTGTTYAPTRAKVSGMTISGFTGNYPALPSYNFQAGVYGFTGGSNAANTLTLTIENMNISGTGRISAPCAGLYFGDFSTASSVMQNITVNTSSISNNRNRGVTVNGSKAVVTVSNSKIGRAHV